MASVISIYGGSQLGYQPKPVKDYAAPDTSMELLMTVMALKIVPSFKSSEGLYGILKQVEFHSSGSRAHPPAGPLLFLSTCITTHIQFTAEARHQPTEPSASLHSEENELHGIQQTDNKCPPKLLKAGLTPYVYVQVDQQHVNVEQIFNGWNSAKLCHNQKPSSTTFKRCVGKYEWSNQS